MPGTKSILWTLIMFTSYTAASPCMALTISAIGLTQLFGKGGVTLIIIIVFMAVTSSGSAEFVAVSSLLSYDVYKTYINPKANGKQVRRRPSATLLACSRCQAVVFCVKKRRIVIFCSNSNVK